MGCKAVSRGSVSRVWLSNLKTGDGTHMKCIPGSGCINKTKPLSER